MKIKLLEFSMLYILILLFSYRLIFYVVHINFVVFLSANKEESRLQKVLVVL